MKMMMNNSEMMTYSKVGIEMAEYLTKNSNDNLSYHWIYVQNGKDFETCPYDKLVDEEPQNTWFKVPTYKEVFDYIVENYHAFINLTALSKINEPDKWTECAEQLIRSYIN